MLFFRKVFYFRYYEFKTLRIIIASGVSFPTLLAAGLGFTGALNQRSGNKDYSDRMKSLDDATLILVAITTLGFVKKEKQETCSLNK